MFTQKVRRRLRALFSPFYWTLRVFGLDGQLFLRGIGALPSFVQDAYRYKRAPGSGRLPLRFRHLRPSLTDCSEPAGIATGHYFHQDLWAARRIYDARPVRHIDVGSRIDGFVAHLLTFMPVEVVDIRTMVSNVNGLSFTQEDATGLGRYPDGSVESISSLHAVEHFGLGRYGDKVDADACFRAMRSLARVLRVGGRLYFSVPIGVERLEFNSHRIFAPSTILGEFASLRLVSFSAVDDAGMFEPNADPRRYEFARYACGLFEFTK